MSPISNDRTGKSESIERLLMGFADLPLYTVEHCLNDLSEAGGPTQHPEVTSLTNTKSEEDFEIPKETRQYWDIRF